MLMDKATAHENHRRFVARVCAGEAVWSLKNPHGFCYAPSNDADCDVLLFWSDRAYAERVRKDQWPDYSVAEIPLFDFLFRWLPGMARDGLLAGTNWDGQLCGLELPPDQVRDEVKAELGPARWDALQARLKAELGDSGPR